MLLISAIVIFSFVMSLNGLSRQIDDKQIVFLENAIRRTAVQCYTIEGRFPDDLNYLEENYSLVIDRNRYNVYYEYMGGNLIPQIWVFPITPR